jgi:hypothetical protein
MFSHTPSDDILHDTREEAVCCINGFGPIHRWVGIEMLSQLVFHAPAPIVACNLFMNSVDTIDQRWSTNPTQQTKKDIA